MKLRFLYDDDDTSDASVRDAWSMAKSAFLTLPHRQSLDIYDDEASPSLSSSVPHAVEKDRLTTVAVILFFDSDEICSAGVTRIISTSI